MNPPCCVPWSEDKSRSHEITVKEPHSASQMIGNISNSRSISDAILTLTSTSLEQTETRDHDPRYLQILSNCLQGTLLKTMYEVSNT